MKSRLIFHLVIVLLLTSCEGIHDLIKLKVDKITYGDCKTDATKSTGAERIEFRTVDKNYLEIKHINAWFNCEPGKLSVKVNSENNTIFVDENEETAMANCV